MTTERIAEIKKHLMQVRARTHQRDVVTEGMLSECLDDIENLHEALEECGEKLD